MHKRTTPFILIFLGILSCNQGSELFVDHVLEMGTQLNKEFRSIPQDGKFKVKFPTPGSKYSLEDEENRKLIRRQILNHSTPIDTLMGKLKELREAESSYLVLLASIGAIAESRTNLDSTLSEFCKTHLGNLASAISEKKLQRVELTKVIRPLIGSYQFNREMNPKLLLNVKQLRSACHEAEKAVQESKVNVKPYPLTNVTIEYEKLIASILKEFEVN